MMKLLRRCFYTLLFFIFVIFFGLCFLLYSQTGLEWSFSTAKKFSGTDLVYSGLSGSLASTVTIKKLSYRSKKMTIEIIDAKLKFKPWALLIKHLSFQSIFANTINIQQDLNLDKKNKPAELSKLPLTIEINHLQINHFYYKNSENISINIQNIYGHIMFAAEPKLQWNINLKSSVINSKKLKKSLAIHLAFDLHTKAEKTATGFIGFIKLNKLQGEVGNKAFNAKIDADFFRKGFNIKHTQIHFGNSSVSIKGGLNTQWNLAWAINIKDFRDFFNLGSGVLTGHGSIIGSMYSPNIDASATGNDLHLFGLEITKLFANVHLNQLSTSQSTIDITCLDFKKYYLKKLQIILLGNLADNNIKLYFVNNHISLDTFLKGGWKKQQWQGNLAKLSIKSFKGENWILSTAAKLSIGEEVQQVDHLCLINAKQTACGSFFHDQTQTKVNGRLTNVNLTSLFAFLNPKLFENIQSESVINGQFNFQKNKSTIGQLNLKISPGILLIKYPVKTQLLQIKQSFITGRIANNQLNLAALINFVNAQAIKANILVTHLDQALSQQKIVGAIKINYYDFSLLKILYPVIQQVSGAINGTLNISGNLIKPSLSGQIKLLRGVLVIPSIGITVKNIAVTATGKNSDTIDLVGHADSGAGILHLQSNIALLSAGLPLHATLTGNKILVMNTPSYKIYVSPNLSIQKNENNYLINGSIEVPTATISPSDFGQNSESLSDDVQFVSNEKKIVNDIYLGNIHLLLGNNINLNIKGLTGQLKGALHINLNSAATTTANGTLTVEKGHYSAYGQTLALKTGKIIYTDGPINNPGIELVGSKTILTTATFNTTMSNNSMLGQSFSLPSSYSAGQQVKVGIRVTGTLKNYTATLFSEPAIYSQSDILSLILTGKTANNLSGNNAQLLLKAASGLNLGGNAVGNITQQLQQFFGLDELGLDSQNYIANGVATQATALTLGKRLTPRLSISYSIGLLTPVNIFLANYSLANHWSLQANASAQDTGADIFYSIER